MGIIFTGAIPAITGPVQLEVPTATYSGISDDTDASVSINPYTSQGPGENGAGQTSTEIVEQRDSGGSSSPGESDPFANNVDLLMNFNGDNGTSNFVDGVGHTINALNPGSSSLPTHSTVASKFGGSSLLIPTPFLNGNGTRTSGVVQIERNGTNDFAFGTGDFTIEFWLQFNTQVGNSAIFSSFGGAGSNTALACFLQVVGSASGFQKFLRFRIANSPTSVNFDSTTFTITDGGFDHYAIVGDGDNIRIFLNGTLVSAISGRSALNVAGMIPGQSMVIGATSTSGPSAGLTCYIDDFRITTGVARYTSNFTPPSELSL